MLARFRSRLTYANLVATLALFMAVSTGGAYAANTILSTDIVDGQVKNADIGGDAVTSGKIAAGAVTDTDMHTDAIDSSKVLDASLSGADISNSSLSGDDVASSSLTGIDVSNGTLTSSDILDETLGTTKIADGGLNTSDLAISSITGSRIAPSAVTTSDIANRTVNMDDIDGADRSGSIDVGAIANGRCTTISGSVSGAEAGDVAVLTTNGSIPSGMTIQAQRALTDAVHIKVCNLTGATSAAISDLPVRVITFH